MTSRPTADITPLIKLIGDVSSKEWENYYHFVFDADEYEFMKGIVYYYEKKDQFLATPIWAECNGLRAGKHYHQIVRMTKDIRNAIHCRCRRAATDRGIRFNKRRYYARKFASACHAVHTMLYIQTEEVYGNCSGHRGNHAHTNQKCLPLFPCKDDRKEWTEKHMSEEWKAQADVEWKAFEAKIQANKNRVCPVLDGDPMIEELDNITKINPKLPVDDDSDVPPTDAVEFLQWIKRKTNNYTNRLDCMSAIDCEKV